MKLKHLKLENFRAKEHCELRFGSRLTVLIGANGAGKTTVLDAVAIGLGEVLTHLPQVSGITFGGRGEIHQNDNSIAPYARITLETLDGLVWDRQTKRDKARKTINQIPSARGVRALRSFLNENVIQPWSTGSQFELPVIAYYGVTRALLDIPLRRRGFPSNYSRFDGLANALEANTRFRSAFAWFYSKENEEHRQQKASRSFDIVLPELQAVRRAIEGMFPDLANPRIEVNPLRFVLEQRTGAGHIEALDIAQLSDGYQTLLGLVIDLASRMAMANPDADDPLECSGVVMIDEVDLHLHPSWQQYVLGDLMRVFPSLQFIVTTHSPFVIEAVNNHLKRAQIDRLEIQNEEIRRLLPLRGEQVAAYRMTAEDQEPMLDHETGLLDDQLLLRLNDINRVYDEMRDLEWQAGKEA